MFSGNYLSLVKKYKSRRQTGQILIIFLLILVVGLALVLSVASRSITDIRTTTTSDESNRAYFAAEAGIEEALRRLQKGSPSDFTADLDFQAVNKTTAKIKSSELSTTGTEAYLLSDALERDDVAQVNLLRTFNDLTNGTAVGASPAKLTIYWGEFNAGDNPAIEVTVLYYNNTLSSWGLEKYAFDPITTNGNNFGQSLAGTCFNINVGLQPTDQGSYNFENKIDLRIREGYAAGSCGLPLGVDMPGINDAIWPVLARVRLLYNSVGQPVAVAADGWTLPSQGSEVESTGSTTSGVTRKLKVRQQYPALPSIFDYVLFSGGDLTK